MVPALTLLAAFLALCLLAGVACLTFYTLRKLTRPPRRTYASALARNRPGDPSEVPAPAAAPGHVWSFREWTFESRGMALPVWEIEGLDPLGPAIILSHGWGDSRIGALTRVPMLAAHASRLVAWEMPGHGEAGGVCALGTREVDDLVALLERVRGASAGPILLLGWSLGAGVSIAAAARSHERVAGVIAESPYRLAITPARNVLAQSGLPHRVNLPLALWLLGWTGRAPGLIAPEFNRAGPAARLAAAGVPLLVIHGARDSISPAEEGRAIAEAHGGAELRVLEAGGHNGLWTDAATAGEVAAVCEGFICRVLERDAGVTAGSGAERVRGSGSPPR